MDIKERFVDSNEFLKFENENKELKEKIEVFVKELE